ncbi:hypothetical protein BLA60_14330 [Actinophytocola xinjiangensis]|uniref:7-cyano-7-deazaguanine synthase n=1 Tax=Actinophytocola xinjiangensis TaxID=485602 RepID=A0A7Z0WMU6_9PSEU|nr:7-cyano-7-deazaguanine synthase [Actinophytocola xinjiangensis]OLF11158.1 hypothetical protein BLA60_14330 [Actinophytocola xinjiangensis]
MTAGARRFEFADPHQHQRGGDWEPLSEDDFRDRHDRLDKLMDLAGAAPDWAFDLLRIARAVYVVDKRYLRAHTQDGWTRQMDLTVHLVAPERWAAPVLGRVAALLNGLTGDQWTITVLGGAVPQRPRLHFGTAGAVTLFSGGLDSSAHAAHLARTRDDRLLFVAFDDVLQETQRQIAESMGQGKALKQVGQTVSRGPLESSSRSRGLLYLASGVCVAAANRLDRVAVPENGQLAVNPPLTSARPSALSTRSVHPWTLSLVNQIIDDIGGDVRVVNPLLHLTKGEVCALAIESGLDRRILGTTISCGNPRGKRFSGYFNCGYCYPCLLRRSGLHHATGDDPTEYSFDLAELTVDATNSGDLRALMRWLSTPFAARDLIADSPFPTDVPAPAVLPIIRRGRQELGTMIESLVPAKHPLRRFWAPAVETVE